MCVFSTEFLNLIQILANNDTFYWVPYNFAKWANLKPFRAPKWPKIAIFIKNNNIFLQKKVCFLGRISKCEHKSGWYRRNPLCHIKLCKIHNIYTPPELKKALKWPKMPFLAKKTCILILRGTPRDQIFPKWK